MGVTGLVEDLEELRVRHEEESRENQSLFLKVSNNQLIKYRVI